VNRTDDGYTLTEMLVVIAIIGLLAAVLTPMIAGQLGRARVKAARLQVENVSTAVEMFRSDVGRYPTAQEGLNGLVRAPDGLDGWIGPYIRNAKSLDDPWGRALKYQAPSDTAPPRVLSLGADGKPGGTGADADIVSS
jgi:general secretion pathway protein G